MRDLIPRRFAVLGAFSALIFGAILVAPAAYAATLVSVEVECGTVTFTNTQDETVYVLYGSSEEESEDGSVEIAAHSSSDPIPTTRDRLDFRADFEEDEESQVGSIDVPQDCDETVDETEAADTDETDDDAAAETIARPTAAPKSGL